MRITERIRAPVHSLLTNQPIGRTTNYINVQPSNQATKQTSNQANKQPTNQQTNSTEKSLSLEINSPSTNQEIPASYGTLKFIKVSTTACQSTPPYSNSVKPI